MSDTHIWGADITFGMSLPLRYRLSPAAIQVCQEAGHMHATFQRADEAYVAGGGLAHGPVSLCGVEGIVDVPDTATVCSRCQVADIQWWAEHPSRKPRRRTEMTWTPLAHAPSNS